VKKGSTVFFEKNKYAIVPTPAEMDVVNEEVAEAFFAGI
jgi:hypothetical protein